MEVLLQTYYILLPIVATAMIGWVGTILKKQHKRDAEISEVRKANSNGIKLILRYMLKRYHIEYLAQGYITYNQYEDWTDIFSAYRALGGNSIAMEWNEDIQHLEKRSSMDELSPFETLILNNMKRKRDVK